MPVIESGEKSDLSLAGTWASDDSCADDNSSPDKMNDVIGPDADGVYYLVDVGPDNTIRIPFLASRLPDASGIVLLQFDISQFADRPSYYYAYAAVEDDLLFIRHLDPHKLTEFMDEHDLAITAVQSTFATELSGETPDLLRMLQGHAKQITSDTVMLRRVHAAR